MQYPLGFPGSGFPPESSLYLVGRAFKNPFLPMLCAKALNFKTLNPKALNPKILDPTSRKAYDRKDPRI